MIQKNTPRVGYSSGYVDRKQKLSKKRKEKLENRSRNESYDDDSFINPIQIEEDNADDLVFEEITYEDNNDNEFIAPPQKRLKYSYLRN